MISMQHTGMSQDEFLMFNLDVMTSTVNSVPFSLLISFEELLLNLLLKVVPLLETHLI